MFDEVSPKYDLLNDVLSVGNSRLWRIATTRAIAPRKGMRILDLAAGTGTSSAALAAHGAHVTAADFSEGMLAEGRRRHAGNDLIDFIWADATQLPFEDDSFDAATISYGLRNVSEPKLALAEMARVVKPGGRVVIAEFSRPPAGAVNWAYTQYTKSRAPAGRRSDQRDQRGLQVPQRVDRDLASPGGARVLAARGRARARRLPQPDARDRSAPPRLCAAREAPVAAPHRRPRPPPSPRQRRSQQTRRSREEAPATKPTPAKSHAATKPAAAEARGRKSSRREACVRRSPPAKKPALRSPPQKKPAAKKTRPPASGDQEASTSGQDPAAAKKPEATKKPAAKKPAPPRRRRASGLEEARDSGKPGTSTDRDSKRGHE